MNQKQIMIVEDERIIARDIEHILKDAGHSVAAIVDNGENAIERAKVEQPDLILMDVYLRGEMDGVQTARELRKHVDIPVVYLTAYGDSDIIQRAKETEPYGFILKPFHERELQVAVELALYKHEMEKNLNEYKTELSAILDHAPVMIMLLDQELRVREINKAMADLLDGCAGEASAPAIGKRLDSFEPPRDPNVVGFINDPGAEHFRISCKKCVVCPNILDTFETGDGHYQAQDRIMLDRNGKKEETPVSISTVPLDTPEGRMVLLYIREITGDKPAGKAPQDNEASFRKMVENQSNGIALLSREGVVRFANPAAVSHYGLKEKDFAGAPFNRIHAAGETSEVNITRENGETVTAEMTVTEMDWAGEKVWQVSLHDVTGQKRMQEQLMLADRLASIGQLAAGVAHEINNPLAGVIGVARLLSKKDIPDWVREELEVLNGEAQRAADVVKGLLSFVRVKGDEKGQMDINSIVEDVLRLRSYEQKVRNIEVETQLSPDVPYISVNGAQIQQVFMNLIVNAEQAMLEANRRGLLKVKTELAGDMVRISFADDGPGISPENMKKLFTPFFTTKDVGKGTGIGLSICHSIVTDHGGSIYADSRLNNGATFNIELPIAVVSDEANIEMLLSAEVGLPL